MGHVVHHSTSLGCTWAFHDKIYMLQGRLSEDEINDVAAYVYDQASNDKW